MVAGWKSGLVCRCREGTGLSRRRVASDVYTEESSERTIFAMRCWHGYSLKRDQSTVCCLTFMDGD